MPGPITDPNLLAQLNGPTPPPQPQQLDGSMSLLPAASKPLSPEQAAAAALQPNKQQESSEDIELKRLKIRSDRIAQGLDPDTGKPLAASSGPTGPALMATLNPEDQAAVKSVLVGKTPINSYMLTRSPQWNRIYQLAQQVEPGVDLSEFARRQTAYQKFMAPNSPVVRTNQALAHLQIYNQKMQDLGNFNNESGLNPAALLNYPKAAMGELMKSPKYQAASVARDAAATELAAAFKGGNDPALASVEHWQKVLSLTNSPQATNSVTQTAVQLLGGRIQALNDAATKLMGPNADVLDLLDPAAASVFKKYNAPDYDPNKDLGTQAETAPSDTAQANALPKGYQAGHDAALAQIPPGQLTVPDYIAIRQKLDQQFGRKTDLDPQAMQDFVNQYNALKGRGPVGSIPVPAGDKPLGMIGHYWAKGSESAPGIAIGDAANAGSFGLPDLAVGDQGREAHQLADEAHPIASFIGDAAGSAVPIVGTEGAVRDALELIPGLKGLSPKATQVVSELLGNSIYGGVRGFNSANTGQGAEAATGGAFGGALGALGGRAVAKGAPGFQSTIKENAINQLKDAGVDLTTLQRLGLGPAENIFGGFPGTHGAQMDAIFSMNKARANDLLSPINTIREEGGAGNINLKSPITVDNAQTPQEINQIVHDTGNMAYNAVKSKINASSTGDFENIINVLKSQVPAGQGSKWAQINDALKLAFDENGHVNGDSYKNADERLRLVRQSFLDGAEKSDDPLANRDMAQLAKNAQESLRDMVKGQMSEKAGQLLDASDRLWAGKYQLSDATNRAKANGGIYSPTQGLTTSEKFDSSSGKTKSSQGNARGQDFLLAAQRVMGSKTPSVTPWSITGGGAALGGGGAATALASPPLAATIGGLVGAGYLPGIKRGVQAALTGSRPKVINNSYTQAAFADALRRYLTGGQ